MVPALTSMFDFRYMLPTLVLFPPAGVLGGLAVARRIAVWRGGRVEPAADEPSDGESPAAEPGIEPATAAAEEEPVLP